MRRAYVASVLLIASAAGLKKGESGAVDVLFIGNSYTFYWNLPQSVGAMAESQNISMRARQSTASSANLAEHWKAERQLQTMERLRSQNFSRVVLQDHSLGALEAPKRMMHYGQLFASEIQKRGAKVYLFMTWARAFNPSMQQTVTAQYRALADQTGARLVPVGLAWQLARERKPGFPLYEADQSHPSPLGTYLTACVFYGVFFGSVPVGSLPHRLTSTDIYGEKFYLNLQSEDDALFCQQVAQEAIQLYG